MENTGEVPRKPKPNLFIKKSPQEVAAQSQNIGTNTFNEGYVPQAEALNQRYKESIEKIGKLLSDGTDDDALQKELDVMYEQAYKQGIVKPSVGEHAQENLEATKKKLVSFGATEKEAEENAAAAVDNSGGYLKDLRSNRLFRERSLAIDFDDFNAAHPLDKDPAIDAQIVAERIKALSGRVIDLNNLTEEAISTLRDAFPGGNFLYHGTEAYKAMQILSSGDIASYSVVAERHKEEEKKAQEEGRYIRSLYSNTGAEGVSWSFNQIHALPGDRYHLAGFVASPNSILEENQQLTIPSRASPFELIQISGAIDPSTFYRLKAQWELLVDKHPIGEFNTVWDNISNLRVELKHQAENSNEDSLFDEPKLLVFLREHTDEQIADAVKNKYTIGEDGTVELSLDLFQQRGDRPIPAAAAWFQALIENGRIKEVPGMENVQTVRQAVEAVSLENFNGLIEQIRRDNSPAITALNKEYEKLEGVQVNTEDLFFVTSNLDLPKWLEILARCDKKPRGILIYDHNKVRLENFASAHRGDNQGLTEQLRLGIKPDPNAGFIDWEKQLLQEELTDDKLAGDMGQVVAEKYLSNRRSIKKTSQGELVIV